jgi:hypothetical protein
MNTRIVYHGEWPDGSELMIERWIDDDGNEVSVTASVKESRTDGWSGSGLRVWGPPLTLTREVG